MEMDGNRIRPAMEMDRLSALPETLLLHILFFHLDMKEAARTALLSKQWRFLWTNLPFSFWERSENIEEIQSFVARVHTALALRRGPALNSLTVSFHYDERFASDVDSWLDFAAKNKVKNLTLYLKKRDRTVHDPHIYTLPQIIYSNSLLTWLSLENCIIAPPPQTTVEWRCLKWLSLKQAKLPQRVIEEIVSGCPVLESLNLELCRGFNRLEIEGRSFRRLSVIHHGGKHLREILAPYMLDLEITVHFRRSGRVVRLENVPSLESARIDFFPRDWDWDSISMEQVKRTTMDLFEYLRHVKILDLSARSTEVLSIMGTNDWQLPRLKIKTARDVRNIYGVVAMLESSPYVEKLSIYPYEDKEEVSLPRGPITRDDLNCDLLHLKTVDFMQFLGSDHCGEQTFTLVQILLKRAPALEKMVIHTTRNLSREEIDLTKKTLLNYPKSSKKVSVEICQ